MSQQLSTLDLLDALYSTLNDPSFLSVPAPSCPIDSPDSDQDADPNPDSDSFTPDYGIDTNLDHFLFTEEEMERYEIGKLTTEEEMELEEAYQFYLNDRLGRYGY